MPVIGGTCDTINTWSSHRHSGKYSGTMFAFYPLTAVFVMCPSTLAIKSTAQFSKMSRKTGTAFVSITAFHIPTS